MNKMEEDLARYPVKIELEHFWYENDGLKLHAVSAGQGPLLVLLHGFPEFWFCWRYQLAPLTQQYRVLVADLRGFNQSDSPGSLSGYALPVVAGDIHALIKASGQTSAVLICHDLGGFVGWHAAGIGPDMIRGLITLGSPQPSGINQAIIDCPEQQEASSYVPLLADEHAHTNYSLDEILSAVPLEPDERELYRAAYHRSGLEAPLGYYRMLNEYRYSPNMATENVIQCPVLAILGADDPYIKKCAYFNNADWTTGSYRFELIDHAGHYMMREQPNRVNKMLIQQLQSWEADNQDK